VTPFKAWLPSNLKAPDQEAVGLTTIAAPSVILSVSVGFLLYNAPTV